MDTNKMRERTEAFEKNLKQNIGIGGDDRNQEHGINTVPLATANYPRSISDERIKAVAKSGGVCSINDGKIYKNTIK